MLQSLINKLEKYTITHGRNVSFKNNLLYIIFIPYFFVLEKYLKYKIWQLVLREMMNDEIFDFLDSNDFEYKKDYFRKSELLSDLGDFYPKNDHALCKKRLRENYIDMLSDVLKASSMDIENYINVLVTIDIKVVHDKVSDQYFRAPIYTLIMQYFRNYHYKRAKKILWIWLSILLVIILFILFSMKIIVL